MAPPPIYIWYARTGVALGMKVRIQFERERLRKIAILFAVLAVAIFACVQAIHFHPELGPAENPHCAICATAHLPAVTVVPVVSTPVLFLAGDGPAQWKPLPRRVALLEPLFGRPPPAVA